MMTEKGFVLHPQLEEDAVLVGRLPLCRVLLMDDRTIPWVVLVPARGGVSEIHDLTFPARARLVEEISIVSSSLAKLHRCDKVNVGALGNIVPQFHVHVVARSLGDRAWPGPVWGAEGGERFRPAERKREVGRLRKALGME